VGLTIGDRAKMEKPMRQSRRPNVDGRGWTREMELDGKCDGGMYTEYRVGLDRILGIYISGKCYALMC
jgi:hypothetical protein